QTLLSAPSKQVSTTEVNRLRANLYIFVGTGRTLISIQYQFLAWSGYKICTITNSALPLEDMDSSLDDSMDSDPSMHADAETDDDADHATPARSSGGRRSARTPRNVPSEATGTPSTRNYTECEDELIVRMCSDFLKLSRNLGAEQNLVAIQASCSIDRS
ncbi:hypothetical protein PMAYCL1PPCAC_00951, partial [Pristionchus mayeri]